MRPAQALESRALFESQLGCRDRSVLRQRHRATGDSARPPWHRAARAVLQPPRLVLGWSSSRGALSTRCTSNWPQRRSARSTRPRGAVSQYASTGPTRIGLITRRSQVQILPPLSTICRDRPPRAAVAFDDPAAGNTTSILRGDLLLVGRGRAALCGPVLGAKAFGV